MPGRRTKISATKPRDPDGNHDPERYRNQRRDSVFLHDPRRVAGQRDERRLAQREHAGDAENQVEPDQGQRHERGDGRQRRGPGRQNPQIRQDRCEYGDQADNEALRVHARLPPPKRIFRLCQSATRIRTQNMTGSWNSAPR